MHTDRTFPGNRALTDPNATRVAVMAVNPYLLHVYWQISQRDLADTRGTLGKSLANARPVLRFYDITCIIFDGTNAHQVFDVEVDLRTMKWNVPIWSADKSYVIDLGYKTADGGFYPMARSNVIRVPRAEPSAQLAEHYLRVEGGQIKSLVPAFADPVRPRKPVEAPRLNTEHGIGKQTREPFEGKAQHVKAGDSARAEHGLKEEGIIPRHAPRTVITEQRPVHGVSYPFDLVHMAEVKFSFGFSSTRPAQGTNS